MEEPIYTATSGVAVLVFTRTGPLPSDLKVLVSKRLDPNRAFYGQWAAAGGDIELCELFMPVLAAQRELREECGIFLDMSKFRFVGAVTTSEAKHCLFYTVIIPQDVEPENTEPHKHSPWQFVSVWDIDALDMPERTQKFIKKAAVYHG